MTRESKGALAGKRLGTYDLTELLGAGGMAEVYLARDINLGRKVAVKVLPRELAADPGYVKRFREEAKRVANLQHPHIIPIYYAGEQDGLLYMVMPVVRESLRSRMERRGQPNPEQAVDLIVQIAGALAAAHAVGLIHRDVKPENILIDGEGNALLTDFGIAREVHRPSRDGKRTMQTMSASGLPVGTPEYMAPEQFLGGSVGPQADIYALGIVLYELLTGHTPRQANNAMEVAALTLSGRPFAPPTERNPRVWPALNRAVMTALEHEPQDRFADVERFSFALTQSLNYRDEPARPQRRRTTADSDRSMPMAPSADYAMRQVPRTRPLMDDGYGGLISRPLNLSRTANGSRSQHPSRPAHASRPVGTQGPMPGTMMTTPDHTGLTMPRLWRVSHDREQRGGGWRRFWWVGLVALLLLGIAGVSLGGILTNNQAALTYGSTPVTGGNGSGTNTPAKGGKGSPTTSKGLGGLSAQAAATVTSISATATAFDATAVAQGTVLPTPTATNTPIPPTPTATPVPGISFYTSDGTGNLRLNKSGSTCNSTDLYMDNPAGIPQNWQLSAVSPPSAGWSYYAYNNSGQQIAHATSLPLQQTIPASTTGYFLIVKYVQPYSGAPSCTTASTYLEIQDTTTGSNPFRVTVYPY